MATTHESSMNISALKLVDPGVRSILDTAAHVVLYSFNRDNDGWEKLNVEGALFVCSRSGDPKFNIMILNRLNTYNLNEPIVDGLDFQLKQPFLLYRNAQGNIHGIWFYEGDECARIAKSLGGLVKSHSTDGLLNKPPDPKKKEITSKRVMDFFAKASNSAPTQVPKKEESHPLIQRLMSNPKTREQIERKSKTLEQIERSAKTVEQIERDVKSLGKVEKSATTPEIVPSRHTLEEIELYQRQNSQEKKRPTSLHVNSTQKVENGISLLSIDSSPIATQSFFNSTLMPDIENSPPKPELITPDMFAQSSKIQPELNLQVKPEPLTKSQLLQAVSYLLRNDPDFLNKLHEAYLKSFVDIVS